MCIRDSLSTIHNEAPISLGDNSKAIVIQTTNTEGATLTLKDSGTNQDIKVGKNGIGVYGEYSNIKRLLQRLRQPFCVAKSVAVMLLYRVYFYIKYIITGGLYE